MKPLHLIILCFLARFCRGAGEKARLPHVDLGSHPDGTPTTDARKNQALFISRWLDSHGATWRRRAEIGDDGLKDGFTSWSRRLVPLRTEPPPAPGSTRSLSIFPHPKFSAEPFHMLPWRRCGSDTSVWLPTHFELSNYFDCASGRAVQCGEFDGGRHVLSCYRYFSTFEHRHSDCSRDGWHPFRLGE